MIRTVRVGFEGNEHPPMADKTFDAPPLDVLVRLSNYVYRYGSVRGDVEDREGRLL